MLSWRPGPNKKTPADFALYMWQKYGERLGIKSVQEYVEKAHWALAQPRSATVQRMEMLNGLVKTYLRDRNWSVASREGAPLFFNFPVDKKTGEPSGSYQWHRMTRKELPLAVNNVADYELALVALRSIDIGARMDEGDFIQRVAKDLFRMRWNLEAQRFKQVDSKKFHEAKKIDEWFFDEPPADRAYQRVVDLGYSAKQIIDMARGSDLTHVARDPSFVQRKRYNLWASSDDSLTPAQSAWATWQKYEAMFPQFHSIHQYVQSALELAQAPISLHVRQWQLASGDWVIYDERRNLWVVTNARRVPKEMFYPGGSLDSKAVGQAQWQQLISAATDSV